MSYKTVGIVTGANKGIGLAIVRQLALQYPQSPLNKGSFLIYLTARNKGRGETALKELVNDDQLKKAKALEAEGGLAEIKFHALDITDSSSIESFADAVKAEHKDGIDFIINNAGIALEGFSPDVVKTTLGCNYYSTLKACHIFLPLLKPQGRIVNLASLSGHVRKWPEETQKRFLASKTEADVDAIMKDFEAAVEAGEEETRGFIKQAYATSKAGLIGATRALAKKEEEAGSKVLINSCCPGWVVTSMTKGRGSKTTNEGAQTPVMLAIQDIEGQTGLFWQHEKVKEW